ncbi:hypothetical protein FRC05_007128 [Tulasnella sp. 425]|nr:hypothetical protein FRC05_007128 [Tulasnella sp. 425]
MVQLTGPYFASLRQTLLGGKSLNRLSNFVTCGAEDWVLNGVSPKDEDDSSASTGSEGVGDADKGQRHIRMVSEDDPNRVDETTNHSRSRNIMWTGHQHGGLKLLLSKFSFTRLQNTATALSGSYTMHCVTSLFQAHSPMHSRFSSASSGHVGESSSSTTLGPSISSRTVTQANAFDIPGKQIGSPLYDDIDEESAGTVHVTVHRRFSHFVFLPTALSRRLPGIALPPLPDKQYTGRFNDEFVEARRGDLEKWLSRVVRYPLAWNSEVVVFFLSCDNETEWRRNLPRFLAPPPSLGPAFCAHVYHQDFNFDSEEAEETVDRFENHPVGVGRGVQGVRGVFGRLREAHVGMSIATRALSYSLLSLITSTPAESSTLSPTSPTVSYPWETEDDGNDEGSGKKGLTNDEGAWCWRDDCEDCLKRTKAYQRTVETLQYIADAYDDHISARRTQYATHDALKDVAHPSATYAGVIDAHRATLSRFDELNQNIDMRSSDPDHARAARCETVVNTTMAEFDNYHSQKGEDFDRIAKEHLDGEIAFHEQILRYLRSARAGFEPPSATSPTGQTYFPASPPASATPPASAFTTMSGRQRSSSMSQYYSALPNGPRQPSIYERDLGTATVHRQPAPLPQPTVHIFDSGVVCPVSTAVNTIVGGIKGGAEGLKETGSVMGVGLPSLSMPGLGDITRGSVFDFGRLWNSGHRFFNVEKRHVNEFLTSRLTTAKYRVGNPLLLVALETGCQPPLCSSNRAFDKQWKSVEVVQAFSCLVYWKEPDDNRTWLFIGYACRLAIELNLNTYTRKPDPKETELHMRERRNQAWMYLVFDANREAVDASKDDLIRNSGNWHQQARGERRPEDVIVGAFVQLRRLSAETSDVFYLRKNSSRDNSDNEMSYADGSEFHFCMLRFFRLHVRLFLNSLGLTQSEIAHTGTKAGSGFSIQALSLCYTSVKETLQIVGRFRDMEALGFGQDVITVMSAYAAIFMLRLARRTGYEDTNGLNLVEIRGLIEQTAAAFYNKGLVKSDQDMERRYGVPKTAIPTPSSQTTGGASAMGPPQVPLERAKTESAGSLSVNTEIMYSPQQSMPPAWEAMNSTNGDEARAEEILRKQMRGRDLHEKVDMQVDAAPPTQTA